METKQNKMYLSRRKVIGGLFVTGAALSTGLVTAQSAFAATHSPLVKVPAIKKLKASIKKKQLAVKKQKLAGKAAKATLQSFTPKTTNQASPLQALDLKATFTEYQVKTTSNPITSGITAGDNGEGFWFAERGANRIGKITPQGAITEYALSLSGYGPGAIANGPDDTYWFTYTRNSGSGNAYIGRFTVSKKQVTLFALPGSIVFGASDIVRGPNDTLWFVGGSNGLVGSLTATGAMTIYTLPSIKEAYHIAAGPDGALWFSVSGISSSDDGIGRLTTSGDYTFYALSGTVIADITMGRSNDLWFTASEDNYVGRITTDGQLTQYILPNNGNAFPDQIAHLGNGTFAFSTSATEGRPSDKGEFIGTVTPAGDVQLFETPNDIEASDMVYAGWANEVWFTSNKSIYKFRVTGN